MPARFSTRSLLASRKPGEIDGRIASLNQEIESRAAELDAALAAWETQIAEDAEARKKLPKPVADALRARGGWIVSTHFTLVPGKGGVPFIADHLSQRLGKPVIEPDGLSAPGVEVF